MGNCMKYNFEQLLVLRNLTDSIRLLENRNVEVLTNELLKQLVNRVKLYRNIDHMFERPFDIGCCCIGPINNELYCGCIMEHLRYEYRYHIAISLLKE